MKLHHIFKQCPMCGKNHSRNFLTCSKECFQAYRKAYMKAYKKSNKYKAYKKAYYKKIKQQLSSEERK